MPAPHRKLQITGVFKGRPVMHCFKFCLALGLMITFPICVLAQSAVGNSHLPIENPADPEPKEAQAIYEQLKGRIAEGYALSKLSIVEDYQSWTRYNAAPYVSATHGSRFVNNYANRAGAAYGTMKEGEKLPVGTVLAKDAITITDDGKQLPGALFVMEKLIAGSNPPTGDWRYVVVNPDGSFFGDTTGDEPQLVDYCHTCHLQVAERDYTFFVREDYRVK